MIPAHDLFSALTAHDFHSYVGVPDSLLKDFCAYVADHAEGNNHVICANEGAAVALAAGRYLASRRPAVVYMQNSGLGNAVNPLVSIADPEVCGIPLLMLIGWRGEPGKKDEPQHVKQGRVTLALLNTLEIPFEVIDDRTNDIGSVVRRLSDLMTARTSPCALVVRAGTFAPYSRRETAVPDPQLTREEAIGLILANMGADDVVVGTTGMTSREIFEHRERNGQSHASDFLTVGAMGHASQIAAGIAMHEPARLIYCLDGDGAALMHMGSLAINGTSGSKNLVHVVLNNGAHDSVGGQPSAGHAIDFTVIAKGCRYMNVSRAETGKQLVETLQRVRLEAGPSFIEIRVRKGTRKDLGRPTTSPEENKEAFMSFLRR